jgi:hypothetical protein
VAAACPGYQEARNWRATKDGRRWRLSDWIVIVSATGVQQFRQIDWARLTQIRLQSVCWDFAPRHHAGCHGDELALHFQMEHAVVLCGR